VLQALTFVHETSVGYIRLSSGAPPFLVLQSSSPGSATPTKQEAFFVGPATLTMIGNTVDAKLCFSYKVFANSTVALGTTPSNAVVIPADAAGPVAIILESSTDLVTWTAAKPGSYGSSTSKRFFRVRARRAVKKAE
jgi:hypothetical protein